MSRRLIYVLVSLLSTQACSQNEGGLTGPSHSIPNVAGTYTGTTTATYPELAQHRTCPTSTSITQGSGGLVSIAPLQLGGDCGGQSVPLGQMTIDTTGALGSESGSIYDNSCGTYDYVASGGFYGRDLQATIVYTSRTCWNMTIAINLTRR